MTKLTNVVFKFNHPNKFKFILSNDLQSFYYLMEFNDNKIRFFFLPKRFKHKRTLKIEEMKIIKQDLF